MGTEDARDLVVATPEGEQKRVSVLPSLPHYEEYRRVKGLVSSINGILERGNSLSQIGDIYLVRACNSLLWAGLPLTKDVCLYNDLSEWGREVRTGCGLTQEEASVRLSSIQLTYGVGKEDLRHPAELSIEGNTSWLPVQYLRISAQKAPKVLGVKGADEQNSAIKLEYNNPKISLILGAYTGDRDGEILTLGISISHSRFPVSLNVLIHPDGQINTDFPQPLIFGRETEFGDELRKHPEILEEVRMRFTFLVDLAADKIKSGSFEDYAFFLSEWSEKLRDSEKGLFRFIEENYLKKKIGKENHKHFIGAMNHVYKNPAFANPVYILRFFNDSMFNQNVPLGRHRAISSNEFAQEISDWVSRELKLLGYEISEDSITNLRQNTSRFLKDPQFVQKLRGLWGSFIDLVNHQYKEFDWEQKGHNLRALGLDWNYYEVQHRQSNLILQHALRVARGEIVLTTEEKQDPCYFMLAGL